MPSEVGVTKSISKGQEPAQTYLPQAVRAIQIRSVLFRATNHVLALNRVCQLLKYFICRLRIDRPARACEHLSNTGQRSAPGLGC